MVPINILTKLRKRKQNDSGQYEVASQWQLMWWKFKKHHMARISLPIIVLMYLVAILCEFVAPHGSLDRFPEYSFAPPSRIRFVCEHDGFSIFPFVYNLEGRVDPTTHRRVYTEDTTQKFFIRFLVEGTPYTLMGIFPGNRRLFGLQGEGRPFFIMGTDRMGRCIFSRIVYGSRISLSFGFIAIFFTFIIGVTLGGLSGYLGGFVDNVVQRIIDVLRCMPTIPLWMALAAAMPRDWSAIRIYLGMVLVMSLIGWTDLGRMVRGKILSLREEDFTMAARLCNASHGRILFRHLIPSFYSFIIVSVTISLPGAILGETALSFLGLGLQAPVVSWGVLLQDAQNIDILAFYPWLMWPAAFVILIVLLFNFLGDGLRDAADPYT